MDSKLTPNPVFEKNTSKVALLFVIAAVIAYPLLRMLQMGHLLTWDEAMNICSIRSLYSLGSDDFSNWFWRHPPLYSLLTLLLAPMRENFSSRIEIMNIVIGAVNLTLLFFVNRRIFGLLTASVSIFLLAVMPGSIFFDLWIKCDHLAVTFGLLSLLLILKRRYAFSALCAGLGFLSKETFLFLYIPVVALFLHSASDKPSRFWRVVMISAIPALTAFWWFVIASRTGPLSSITQHIDFAAAKGSAWGGILAFSFYPLLIYKLTHPAGLTLLIVGLLMIIAQLRYDRIKGVIWPALPLIATLLFLSMIPRKVPWIVIVLLPCIATAQAMALSSLIQWISRRTSASFTLLPLCVLLTALLSIPQFGQSHEEMLKSVSPDQYRGATRSRAIALAASNLMKDSDRVMLSSFHYWKGIEPGQLCPIFTCYFKPRSQFLSIPHDIPFEEMVTLIVKHNLTWAIVSPDPGEHEADILGGFISDAGLTPVNLGYACIFDCNPLLQKIPSTLDDEITESLE